MNIQLSNKHLLQALKASVSFKCAINKKNDLWIQGKGKIDHYTFEGHHFENVDISTNMGIRGEIACYLYFQKEIPSFIDEYLQKPNKNYDMQDFPKLNQYTEIKTHHLYSTSGLLKIKTFNNKKNQYQWCHNNNHHETNDLICSEEEIMNHLPSDYYIFCRVNSSNLVNKNVIIDGFISKIDISKDESLRILQKPKKKFNQDYAAPWLNIEIPFSKLKPISEMFDLFI